MLFLQRNQHLYHIYIKQLSEQGLLKNLALNNARILLFSIDVLTSLEPTLFDESAV